MYQSAKYFVPEKDRDFDIHSRPESTASIVFCTSKQVLFYLSAIIFVPEEDRDFDVQGQPESSASYGRQAQTSRPALAPETKCALIEP